MNITALDPTTTIVATINGSDYPARVIKTEVTLAGYVAVTLSYRNSLGVWDDLTVAATTAKDEWHTFYGRLPVTFRPMERTRLGDLVEQVAEDNDPVWSALFITITLGINPADTSSDYLLDEDQVERVLNRYLDLKGTPA